MDIKKSVGIDTLPPRDFEILGWCPAGPVLPHGEVPLRPWLATVLVMASR